jgi:LysR family transcriptional regulator, nitrogen assimilation regulatory protein
MDVRQLEYFLAVADNGGITRAAAVLHIAQPSLSQAIRGLERELKEPLFHRAGHGMILSPAGEALVGPAREALRSVERAREIVATVRSSEAGRLDVAAVPGLAAEPVASWLGQFRRRHPLVALRIDEVADSAGVAESVQSGASEIGFVTLPVTAPKLVTVELSDQYLVLVLPPGWAAETGETVPLSSVDGLPFVVDGRHTSGWVQTEEALLAAGVSMRVAAEVRHPSSTLPLVLAGAGATFMPLRLATQAHRLGAIVQAVDPPIVRRVAVVCRPNGLTGSARSFLDMITKDATRWIRMMRRYRADGVGLVAAALAVDDTIYEARRTITAP